MPDKLIAAALNILYHLEESDVSDWVKEKLHDAVESLESIEAGELAPITKAQAEGPKA